jgi:hypothetical protein
MVANPLYIYVAAVVGRIPFYKGSNCALSYFFGLAPLVEKSRM